MSFDGGKTIGTRRDGAKEHPVIHRLALSWPPVAHELTVLAALFLARIRMTELSNGMFTDHRYHLS